MDPHPAHAEGSGRSASLRRLHELVRTVNGDLDLDRTLAAVCQGVVEGLGFGAAVVNLVMPDGCLEVVACAGDELAEQDLMGQRGSRQVWDSWLATCDPVGDLLVDYRHEDAGTALPTWVPDLPASGVAGAWQAADALLAPLTSARSGLLGVISADLPEDGMRPGRDQLDLLEMYAAQASVAVENARLHSTLLAQDEARSRALSRLSAVVDSAPVGIVELDLHGRVQLWNDAAERIFGWAAAEVLGLRNPVAPKERYDEHLRDLLSDGVLHRDESFRTRRDGSLVDVEMTSTALLDGAGRPYGYLGVYVDVGHRRQLERELRAAAYTDALTGLANRARVTTALHSARPGVHLALLDLDGFKDVNDTYGHPAGDTVLVEVARRLRAVCRDHDLVARLGGDEFVVLLTPSPHDPDAGAMARTLAVRVVDALAEPFAVAGGLVQLGVSVGLARLPHQEEAAGSVPALGEAGDVLLRDADVALYAAKAAGKGCVRIFDPTVRQVVPVGPVS